MHSSFLSTPDKRVHDLKKLFGASSASAAHLLCDRYDADRAAYHILDADLDDRVLSYGDLQRESRRVAAGLAAMGIGQGDCVATLMGKSRNYLIALVAIWRLGAVHVPLFTAFAPPEIALRLEASGAKLIVCDAAQRAKLDTSGAAGWKIVTTGAPLDGDTDFQTLLASTDPVPPPAAVGGDGALIQIFTSGTTGRPKGVAVPLRALASFQIYAEYGLGLCPDDRFWNAADPGWAYGLYFGILASLITGVESFLYTGGFSPEATARILEDYRITNLAAAPTVYRSLEHAGVDFGKLALRCASSAGEPLTPEVNEWAARALGVEVRDHYGQTEAGMMINNHHHPELKAQLRAGSMGVAMPGWTAEILQESADAPAAPGQLGRVAIDIGASPLFWFDGYIGEPDKSAQKFSPDGRWYLTGDIGRRDEDGFFYFASRDDDVIIMAGYRIGPVEIEAVLTRHPAVLECAAVAVEDAVRGEVLEAAVVLAAGFEPSEELSAELQTKVKREFAAHAYPRQIHYVASIPKTASGKLQRFLVRKTLAERAKLPV
jgi:acetyl-CoA synthetase